MDHRSCMSIFERSKKMEQISLEDINLDMIPINVLQDVDKRIADWRSMGVDTTKYPGTLQRERFKKVGRNGEIER